MATASKAAYENNTIRARYFLRIHEDAQKGRGSPPLPYRELPRAAVVFSVGAIDAYLSEVSAEVMIRQFRAGVANKEARDVLQRVLKDIPTLSLEVAILTTSDERVQRVQDAVAGHFHTNVSDHGQKAVSAAIVRMGRMPNQVWDHLVDLGHKNPHAFLDHWTSIRHRIVHQGERPPVRRGGADDFIAFADDLVARVDAIAEQA